jgi:hypothetical protein
MVAQVILGLIALLAAFWIIMVIIVLIIELVNFIIGIPGWIYDTIVENWVISILLIGLLFLSIYFAKKMEKKRKDADRKEREEQRRLENERSSARRRNAAEAREVQRKKEAEISRRNAVKAAERKEKKRKDDAAKKEKKRKEEAARKIREREAELIESVITQCRKDGMPLELTNEFLPNLLSRTKNPSHRQVLLNIWQPLGKPDGQHLEVWQKWMLTQVNSETNMKSIKSSLNKLKKQVVNPLEKDLHHLVGTAHSLDRYDKLVNLWKKFQDMEKSDEVIKRIYKGQNEDYVLADLDLLQD